MSNSALRISPCGDGLYGIVPPGAPTVLDPAAAIHTMVLEVVGGHLTWNLLDGQLLPAAVIDDVDAAQEWVWAIYGEPVALALAEAGTGEHSAAPVLSPLAVSARRLAYAHWAARWWPASTLDSIAPLDPALLDRDIAALTEECDPLVDGADAVAPAVAAMTESFPRASDYALAAGLEPPHPDGIVLGRGTNGWDWRLCPPGLIDASERAVSWRVTRTAATTSVEVSVAAAPGTPSAVPAHLRPWARIITAGSGNGSERANGGRPTQVDGSGSVDGGHRDLAGGSGSVDGGHPDLAGGSGSVDGRYPTPTHGSEAGDGGHIRADADSVETDLRLSGDAWVGSIRIPAAGSVARVDIRVPGFGVFLDPGTPELRRRIRDFAAGRLRFAGSATVDAGPDVPLLAEIAAAADDSDF
ncbi:hypothetical protein [Nocardia inohanensis]|uniref:hypothetical protein n=1 Tax=Nocardia inohanensis TaxID=209246 RepID=UPI0008305FD6|nr:hypothetical protein [Nocardia inohanensis]